MSDATTPDNPADIGDLVIVPYPAARERIGCPAEVGLLLEDRRSVGRVHFPQADRTLWLEHDQLERVDVDRLPVPQTLRDLHAIARQVDAIAIEMHDDDGLPGVYLVYAQHLRFEDLVFVREQLGARLGFLRIEAGSARRVRIRMQVRD